MDHCTPLKLHTVLAFEGMPCHIEEVIGQGSNAIVYKGWYPTVSGAAEGWCADPALLQEQCIEVLDQLFQMPQRAEKERTLTGCSDLRR